MLLRPLGQLSKRMAPKVGFEPTTIALTVRCSTTELLRNNIISLAASYSHRGRPPTTIGAKELNFRVRDGNGCGLFAITTRLIVFLKDKFYYTNSDRYFKLFLKKL